jgi:hypothetical protein
MSIKGNDIIKGVNRSVVIINPDAKSVFETAFFILKKDVNSNSIRKDNIVIEANKIIAESYFNSKCYPMQKLPFAIRRRTLALLMFTLGILFGATVCYLVMRGIL